MSRWMVNGTTIVVPEQTFIDPQVQIGADTIIEPCTQISGQVVIGDNCHIGPHAVITGPISRITETDTIPGIREMAPNAAIEGRVWMVSTTPMIKPVRPIRKVDLYPTR